MLFHRVMNGISVSLNVKLLSFTIRSESFERISGLWQDHRQTGYHNHAASNSQSKNYRLDPGTTLPHRAIASLNVPNITYILTRSTYMMADERLGRLGLSGRLAEFMRPQALTAWQQANRNRWRQMARHHDIVPPQNPVLLFRELRARCINMLGIPQAGLSCPGYQFQFSAQNFKIPGHTAFPTHLVLLLYNITFIPYLFHIQHGSILWPSHSNRT